MSAESVPVAAMNLKAALAYIKAELNPMPVKAGDKVPLLKGWEQRTHATPEEAFEWFGGRPNLNVGLICGPQPSGKYLWALDVDPKNNGDERLYELEQKYGPLPDTAWHGTPSGGKHFFFEGPADYPYTNPAVLAGLDTRTHGGQVVAPPSQTAIGAYTHVLANAVHRAPWAPVPGYLLDLVEAAKAAKRSSVERPTPTLSLEPGRWSAADWVRDHLDWTTYLLKHGWVHVRGELWRHPSATNEHSAALKNGGRGPLNGWSPNLPPSLMRLDRSRTDGTSSFSLFDFIAAYEHDGDTHRCGQWAWRTYGPGADLGWRAAPQADSTGARGQGDAAVGTTVPMPLPATAAEYWSRARNAQIFQAARARLVFPDALDAAMYALQSCLIPPGFLMERPAGPPQPLNMLACLVARTGDFKTSTFDTAKELMGPFPPWVTSIGMGSGEGIGAMFLSDEYEEDAKGKRQKTGRLVRNDLKGVFFESDEGSGTSKAALRQGATIIANLCKAWSGSMLGEANADMARRRNVQRNDYRIGALINIQPSVFGDLFSEANTGTGLTGRFLFSGTLDADIPDVAPEWPGLLEFPVLPQTPVTITMDAAIKAEAVAAVRARHRSGGLDGGADNVAQTPATLARMAAILALSEDRRHVTEDDWALASMRAAASAGCLEALDAHSKISAGDRRHSQDLAKAVSLDRTDTEYDRLKTGQASDRILAVLADGRMSDGNLTAKLAKSCRDYRDDATSLLAAMGKIRKDDQWWELT